MTEPINSLRALQNWNRNPTEEKPEVDLNWFTDWFFREVLAEDQHFTAAGARKDLAKFYELTESIDEAASLTRVDTILDEWAQSHSVVNSRNTTYISTDKERDWNTYLYKFQEHYVKSSNFGLKMKW